MTFHMWDEISDDIHFAWQAQYLVMLAGDFTCSRLDDFIVGYPRISSDYGRIVFLLAEALQGFSAQILTFKISWQAQYLVRLEGDLTGSAHWK